MIGIGCWKSEPKLLTHAILEALKVGYRRIDAALVYKNEKEVGAAIKEWMEKGGKREDLWITTKLWCAHWSKAEEAVQTSLKNLNISYLDEYLIHWPYEFVNPNPNKTDFDEKDETELYDEIGCVKLAHTTTLEKLWKQMEGFVKKGLTKHIGVSNFDPQLLNELMKFAEIKPFVNQVECHPYLIQGELVNVCKKFGIGVEAYSPLGSGALNLLKDETILKISKKHSKTPAQICLRFNIERGIIVLPKSTNDERIKENFNVFDFKLDEQDMNDIYDIQKRCQKRYISLTWMFGY